jgi:hypothetical protein
MFFRFHYNQTNRFPTDVELLLLSRACGPFLSFAFFICFYGLTILC